MKYLIKPHDGIWVAVQENTSEDSLRDKILQADVCISDLDDTDAESPAQRIVRNDFLFRISDKNYRRWLWDTFRTLRRQGKQAQGERWKEYVSLFLRDEGSLQRVRDLLSPATVRESLLPGVEELYSLITQESYCLTRNIEDAAKAYQAVLGHQVVFPEVYDKKDFMERFVQKNPHFQRYLVREDSMECNGILGVLRFYEQKKKIEYGVGQFVADEPFDENHGFDVETGKDQTGLVELLRKE